MLQAPGIFREWTYFIGFISIFGSRKIDREKPSGAFDAIFAENNWFKPFMFIKPYSKCSIWLWAAAMVQTIEHPIYRCDDQYLQGWYLPMENHRTLRVFKATLS